MKRLVYPPLPKIARITGLIIAAASSTLSSSHADFVPGSGGSIPNILPFTEVPNRISGLMVEQCDRENNTFGGGTRAVLDLAFAEPSTHGANGYRLQRSLNGTSNWEDQPWNSGVMETSVSSQNNFSFNPDGAYFYRLLVLGGPKNGYTSNAVAAPLSGVDTRFAGWSLDESMSITGVMWPWVGRGISASFTVRQLSDDANVANALSYQWYRIHPLSDEMTPISGATYPTYTTTMDDVGGWRLLCKATANGTTAGGFCQVRTSGAMIPNNSSFTNLTATGFRLNLYKSLPSLVPADLILTYWNGSATTNVPITGVTALTGNASFNITTTIPTDAQSLHLGNRSDTWKIVSEMAMGHLMEGLSITIPTGGFAPEITVQEPAGSNLTDGAPARNFGTADVGKTGTVKTITLKNTGSADLTGLAVTKDGANAADFTVSALPVTTLAAGASTTFKVTYKPTAKGTRVAAIHIASNDSDENPFDINLSGTATVPAPEIAIEQPAGSGLVDGKAKKSFGTVPLGEKSKARTFTIRNTGGAPLTGLAITKNGANKGDFIVTSPARTSVAPGGSTTFKVTFKPGAKGTRNAAIHIKSNDSDESAFDISLTGLGAKS